MNTDRFKSFPLNAHLSSHWIIVLIAAILFLFSSINAHAYTQENTTQTEQKSVSEQEVIFDYTHFREIPILHDGRVKPIESYARAFLKAFHGKESVEGLSSVDWLTETLFDQDKAYKRRIFNVANPDVLYAIGLEWREKHRYSFSELAPALDKKMDMLATIYNTEEDERTLAQDQTLMLYFKVMTYNDLSRALSSVGKEQIKNILKQKQQVSDFRIIPPQWEDDGELWHSPYSTLIEGRGSPHSAAYIKLWNELKESYENKNTQAWLEQTLTIKNMAYGMAKDYAKIDIMQLEVKYHDLNLFTYALGLYILAFVLILTWLFTPQNIFYTGSFAAISIAALLQCIGIILRIIIMDRPPVSTLYETMIFVSLIAIITCLSFEAKKKDGVLLIVSSIIGATLLFISTRYAAQGDTMEMLVAVLNTNFWLATHVVTITMGYGCTLVAGTLAHIYLIKRYMFPDKAEHYKSVLDTTIAVSLIALFFSILGTILGGIWADQSWGRFWGWDPKENGAMLICLWLLWLLHGRITATLNSLNFMSLMVGANICVALAWFGVNLLAVGLHSYGFTDGIARNLALFCGGETLFVLVMHSLITSKENNPNHNSNASNKDTHGNGGNNGRKNQNKGKGTKAKSKNKK